MGENLILPLKLNNLWKIEFIDLFVHMVELEVQQYPQVFHTGAHTAVYTKLIGTANKDDWWGAICRTVVRGP